MKNHFLLISLLCASSIIAQQKFPPTICGVWTSDSSKLIQIFPKGLFRNGIVEFATITKSGENKYSFVLNDGTSHTLSLREDNNGTKSISYNDTTYVPKLTAVGNSKDTNWTFAPEQYKDKATTPGKALVKGYFDNYTPKLGYQTVMFSFSNQITLEDFSVVTPITPEGYFETELPLPGPYWCYLSNIRQSVYAAPFDTVFIYKDLANSPSKEKLMILGSDDAVAINTLQPIIDKKVNLLNDWTINNVTDNKLQPIFNSKQALLNKAESFSSQTADILMQYALSDYVKNQLVTDLYTTIFTKLINLCNNYNRAQYVYKRNKDGINTREINPDFIPLPEDFYNFYSSFYTTVLNNPLFGTTALSWEPLNRFEFSPAMRKPPMIIWNKESASVKLTHKDSILLRNKESADVRLDVDSILIRLQKHGIDTCYMSDYAIARSIKSKIVELDKNKDLGTKLNTLAIYLPMIKSDQVRSQIMQYVIEQIVPTSGPGATLHQELLSGKLEEEAFAKLIKPYEGNVLMIDFWNMGCGPCRAEMLMEREKVKRLKDKKIKFLYVTCDVDSPIEYTEKFLNDNNIKGEQIRLSKDEWNLLSAKLHIFDLPHQTLVNKKGEILMNKNKGIKVNEPVLLQLEQE